MLSLFGVNHRALRYALNGSVGVGIIIGGWWSVEARLDGRYASAAEFREHQRQIGQELKDLHVGQLETRHAILSKELFDLQNAAAGRALTVLEQQRMRMVSEEVRRIEEKMREAEGRP